MAKGRARKREGARDLAQLLRSTDVSKLAKRFKVSVSTVQRWKRDGVPRARRNDVAKAAKKTQAPKPRNVKWRDPQGRWRNRDGSFTSPPHRKKTEWPRPRKAPPAPKPTKRRPLGPPALPEFILHPKPGNRFPPELLAAFGKEDRTVGTSAAGAFVILPASIEILAEQIGRSPDTIRRWIREDKVPPDDLANLRAVLRGARPHLESYESGRRAKWTPEEWADLRRVGEEFKNGWEQNRAGEAYRAWREVKDRIRAILTKKAWKEMIDLLGDEIGLSDTGRFSKEMWRIS